MVSINTGKPVNRSHQIKKNKKWSLSTVGCKSEVYLQTPLEGYLWIQTEMRPILIILDTIIDITDRMNLRNKPNCANIHQSAFHLEASVYRLKWTKYHLIAEKVLHMNHININPITSCKWIFISVQLHLYSFHQIQKL